MAVQVSAVLCSPFPSYMKKVPSSTPTISGLSYERPSLKSQSAAANQYRFYWAKWTDGLIQGKAASFYSLSIYTPLSLPVDNIWSQYNTS